MMKQLISINIYQFLSISKQEINGNKIEIFRNSLYLVCLIFILISPISVDAHILKTDSTIGAVVHIDPDDDPIISEPAYFYFEFKDTQNKFDLKNCNCKVSIKENEKVIYNTKLESSAGSSTGTSATFNYIFPEKGE